ncbi:MAG: (deoxy)nucleoside triphosphate pyrophosphohydrolase [Fibrobacterota bacterium]
MTKNITVPVVCAIIIKNGRFLAALRSQAHSRAGLWEFPGGKVHQQESPAQALQREIMEELDVEIAILAQQPTTVCTYPDISISLMPFIAQITGKRKPVAHEHEEIRWVDCSEAQNLCWAEADIPVLNRFCRQANRWLCPKPAPRTP